MAMVDEVGRALIINVMMSTIIDAKTKIIIKRKKLHDLNIRHKNQNIKLLWLTQHIKTYKMQTVSMLHGLD